MAGDGVKPWVVFLFSLFFAVSVLAVQGQSVSQTLDSGLVVDGPGSVDGNSTGMAGQVSSPELSYSVATSVSSSALVGMVFLPPAVIPPVTSGQEPGARVTGVDWIVFTPGFLKPRAGSAVLPGASFYLDDLELYQAGYNPLFLSMSFDCSGRKENCASFCQVVSPSVSFELPISTKKVVKVKCFVPNNATPNLTYVTWLVFSSPEGNKRMVPVSFTILPSSILSGAVVTVSETKDFLVGFLDYGLVCFGFGHADCAVRNGNAPLFSFYGFDLTYISVLDLLLAICIVMTIPKVFRLQFGIATIVLLAIKIVLWFGIGV